jgi:hypothetical protein
MVQNCGPHFTKDTAEQEIARREVMDSVYKFDDDDGFAALAQLESA